jgi:hypothetical protein
MNKIYPTCQDCEHVIIKSDSETMTLEYLCKFKENGKINKDTLTIDLSDNKNINDKSIKIIYCEPNGFKNNYLVAECLIKEKDNISSFIKSFSLNTSCNNISPI